MKNFKTNLTVFASACVMMHVPLSAQKADAITITTQDETTAKQFLDEAKERLFDKSNQRIAQQVQSNSNDAAFGVLPTRFNLITDQDGESATLTIGSSNSKLGGLSRKDYSIKFTAPFDQSEDRGDLLTQNGLPDAYSVEASISFKLSGDPFGSGSFKEGVEQEVLRRSRLIREFCEKAQKNPTVSEESKKVDCKGDIRLIPPELGGTPEIELYFEGVEDQYLKTSYLALQLSGGVGVQGFDHRDPATLAEIEDDRTVASATASLVYLPKLKSSLAYIAGAEFERDFDLPDEEIRCPAGATTASSVTCFTAAFGPPVLEEDITLFAGLRFISTDERLPIGGELRFAINPDNGEWGVEAPIYFLRSAGDNLNAGVRIAYDSEMDDAFFGVFVGQNFGGLLGQ